MRKEITIEQVFNDDKKEGLKEFIDNHKQETLEEVKDLAYYRANAEEDYLQVPISVLRYISELEERSYSLDEIKTAMKNGYGIKYFSEHTFLKNLNNLKKK